MNLSQQDWVTKLEVANNAIIIDVRTEEECSEGIIANAILLDIYKGQEFMDEINKLNKEVVFFIYCRSGSRGAQACAIMNQLGFKNTYNLIGGFLEWTGNVVLPE